MRIKKGDLVQVITGADKGKTGKILEIDRERQRARVDGVATIKRHYKPGRHPSAPEGGIIEKAGTVHVSNLMLVDPKTDQPTRVRMQIGEDGKKVRVAKRSGEIIE